MFHSRLLSSLLQTFPISMKNLPINKLKCCLKNSMIFNAQQLCSQSTNQKNLEPSKTSKFEIFEKSQISIILDVDEEMTITPKERKPLNQNKLSILNTTRGKTGVFDIDHLVQVLQLEKMDDIVVINVPPEQKYCTYLVIASAKSVKHLEAISLFINKLYKAKKNEHDPFVFIEGKESKDWKVLDMGSIVLHLFLKQTREKYDIESLWTLGPEYDDKIQRAKQDEYVDLFEKHFSFLQNYNPEETKEKKLVN